MFVANGIDIIMVDVRRVVFDELLTREVVDVSVVREQLLVERATRACKYKDWAQRLDVGKFEDVVAVIHELLAEAELDEPPVETGWQNKEDVI